jgi:CRP-like cAMP-binding protein
MSQHLIEKIQSYIEIEEEDRQFIQLAFKSRRYAKGEHFLLAGDACGEAAFVERGVFRFYINFEGEEANYYFSAENEFVCDYPSFLRQNESDKNIQALEAAEVYAISYSDLQAFYRKVRFGERFGRLIAEEIFVDSIGQLSSFYQDKPEERYQNFVQRFPHLAQRLPQYHIASYVGIKPQSLSRIRRRLLPAR